MTEATVNTVVGPISPDELGVTLVHEHIVFGLPGWYGDTAAPYDRAAVVDAAARVQRELGVLIITHTEEGTMGPEQAELLIAGGADPERIMIGHMSDNVDLSYQLATLEQGVSVAFDRMGLEAIPGAPSDQQRIDCLIELIGRGFIDRLMISHDSSLHWLGREFEIPEQLLPLIVNWHPTHLFRDIIPALEEGGVTGEQVRTIIEGNPRR